MLALLFFATTINYLDRIVLSVLIPQIRQDLHIDDIGYGNVTAAFQGAYTIGFLVMGKFIDRYGTRLGYAVSIGWWSIAAGLHVVATSAVSLGFWRGMLGLGEAGNFPSAIKAVAEWFPRKDRAFATGIFNAGSNVASMVGPPLFVYFGGRFGWRVCFLATASLGFVLLIAWWSFYRPPQSHSAVSPDERAYIESGSEVEMHQKLGWLAALRIRQTWGFAAAKFFSDPVWWFYLFWLPSYLYDARHFKMDQIGWALPVVYLAADVGSVGGGWLSGFLIRRGWAVASARKLTMGLCACCMPFAALAFLAESPVLAIALVGLATAAHQGWSANLYTTVSDVFPPAAVASVTGIGGCFGGLGGTLFSAFLAGRIVAAFGYGPMFVIMGTFHLLALVFVHLFLLRSTRGSGATPIPITPAGPLRSAPGSA